MSKFFVASFDWTIKLWSLKQNRPIFSFEDNSDYVTDVAWSPVHPALFAASDCTGRLDLWDLNSATEVPTATVFVEGAPALNRVSWTQSGLHVTAGDDNGKIWVFDLNPDFANPGNIDWPLKNPLYPKYSLYFLLSSLQCTVQRVKNREMMNVE